MEDRPSQGVNQVYSVSILFIAAANVAYHLCQKAIHSKADPFVSLLATYTVSMVLAVALWAVFRPAASLGAEIQKLNWASYWLGVPVVLIEAGFLMAYRAGWKISIAALYSNLIVTLLLIPVGILWYREKMTLTNTVGVIFAIAGLFLMGKR